MTIRQKTEVLDVKAGIAIDATGVNYDGAIHKLIETEELDGVSAVFFEVGVDPTATDGAYDIILNDYTAGAGIVTLSESGAVARSRSGNIKGDLVAGNEVGVKVDVTTASATTGATARVVGKLILVY